MTLLGKSILIVEDESDIAVELDAALSALGVKVVGPVQTVDSALDTIAITPLDGAIVDLRLMGQRTFRIADALAARQVPFVFATAMSIDEAPARYAGVPWLEKPYTVGDILHTLEYVMSVAGHARLTGSA